MLPGRAKSVGSRILHWARLDHWGFSRNHDNLPVVLGYHRVVESFPSASKRTIPAMLISNAMFECHLDSLGMHYSFISLDELAEALEEGRPFDRPVAAVTFDDGYSDVYYNAFPILKRKGIPAAAFVVTGLVGTSCVPDHDRLYNLLVKLFTDAPYARREFADAVRNCGLPATRDSRRLLRARTPYDAMRSLLTTLSQSEILRVMAALEKRIGPARAPLADEAPMTWEMVSEMHRAGITIGSHTKTHPVLTNESYAQAFHELADSRRNLEARLGVSIRHLAYPDGRFDAETITAAAAAGYQYGYTTCQHRDQNHPTLTIPRRVLWENSWLDSQGQFSPAIMNCQLGGWFDLVAGCPQEHRRPGNFGSGAPQTSTAELKQ